MFIKQLNLLSDLSVRICQRTLFLQFTDGNFMKRQIKATESDQGKYKVFLGSNTNQSCEPLNYQTKDGR